MTIRNLSVLFILLFGCHLAWAKKEVVFFGGGGEPPGRSTIFDSAYKKFGLFSVESGWLSRSYFDGGHADSEALAQKKFKGQNNTMSTKNVTEEIERLKARIKNGDLKKGDQVMITIATHGFPWRPPEKSHGVATVDGEVNLDRIIELRNLAEKNGVSLAIADFSCHSGNTLRLGTDKTCVISASGDGVAYNRSGESIGSSFERGLNLEEAFLKGRNKPAPAAPQINTEAGLKAYELTKVLGESMQVKSLIRTDIGFTDVCFGVKSSPYKKVLAQLAEIGKSTDVVQLIKGEFGLGPNAGEAARKLHAAMRAYEAKRTRVQKAFEVMTAEDQRRCVPMAGATHLCGSVRTLEHSYKYLKKKESTSSLSEREKQELLALQRYAESEGFKRWQTASTTYKSQPSLYSEAEEVARAERDVYQSLYEHFSKAATKPNPCRSFIL